MSNAMAQGAESTSEASTVFDPTSCILKTIPPQMRADALWLPPGPAVLLTGEEFTNAVGR